MPNTEELEQELETTEEAVEEETSEENLAAQTSEDDAETASGVEEEEKPSLPKYDAEYWKGEYYREKHKRQQLQREGTDLTPSFTVPTVEARETPLTLEGVKTVGDFAKYILSESDRRQEARLGEAEKTNRIRTTQAIARSHHEDYDEVLNESVLPMIRQNPKIYELLRELPNPAEAAYTLGTIVRSQANNESAPKKPKVTPEARREAAKELSQKELRPKILKAQRRVSAEPSKTLSADELMNMSDDDFELEIRKTTGRGGSY